MPLRSESACLPGVTLALAAPGPPVQLRWTTLRVQGPTLRDAALANDGDGSPPVAPRLRPRLPQQNIDFESQIQPAPSFQLVREKFVASAVQRNQFSCVEIFRET